MAFSTLNLNFSSESITTTTSISIFPKNTASFLSHKPSVHFSPKISMQTINLKTTNVSIRCSSLHRRPIYTPGRIPDKNYVRVFDTTLRDGEQAPGAGMTVDEKLSVARKLAELRVDIIEAGFPASSKDNFKATELIAKKVGNAVDESGFAPVITPCGSCVRGDINAAWDAVKHAKHPRVVVFIATTEIHMMYESKKTKAEVLKMAAEMVAYARSLCDDVGFVCENDGRSDKEFLYQVYGEAIKAGASTITFTDTVGYNFPNEIENFIGDMKANVPGIENAVIGIHCHNDLGLATANALAGVYSGARQVDVTVNGIGERAGNTPLEEFVMAIKCRGSDELGGLHTGIDTKHIITTSMMVEEYTGHPLQPHKAIVGANVFSRANGIHQDGTLKHQRTFQIIYPEDIGLSQSDCQSIVLQKLSGRHASTYRLSEKPLELHSQAWQEFQLFRRLLSLFNKNTKGPDIDDQLQKLKAAVGAKKMLKGFRMIKILFSKFLISSTSTKR